MVGQVLALGVGVGALAVLALVIGGAGSLISRPDHVAVSEPGSGPARPAWIDSPDAVRLWSLQSPVLQGLPLVYTTRREEMSGGGREDVMRFGALGLDRSALRLRIVRRGKADSPVAPPLYAAIARQAADAGLGLEHASLPGLLKTRFGDFEIANTVLTGLREAPAAKLNCTGFRLFLTEPSLTIAGLTCDKEGDVMPREDLGCLLDHLDLVSGNHDVALVAFVSGTILRRAGTCPD